MILSILMQVLRISIGNRYDTGCVNTVSHTLIINDNTPLSLTHNRSQLLTSNKLQELVLTQWTVLSLSDDHMHRKWLCHVKYRYKLVLILSIDTSSSDASIGNINILASPITTGQM